MKKRFQLRDILRTVKARAQKAKEFPLLEAAARERLLETLQAEELSI
jgi:hypothetical protein